MACFNKLTNKWLRIAAGSRQLIGLLPAKLLIFSKQWVFWHLILRQAEIELWSMPYRLTALPAELLRIPSVRNTTGWDWPQCTILRSEVECASTQIGTCFFDCQIWFNVYILKIAPVYSNYMLFCSSTKRKGGYKGPGRPMRKARGWFLSCTPNFCRQALSGEFGMFGEPWSLENMPSSTVCIPIFFGLSGR